MSKDLYQSNFFDHFKVIYDLRQEGKVDHKLIDILFIAVAATICYCNDWADMVIWAKEKEEWLRNYLELPNGIPSWWTFKRVFDVIDPKQFAKCFTEWMKEITEMSKGTIVAIDGKTACGTADKSKGKKGIHIVNAWCSANHMVLGQVKTDAKSNEITAVPELLDMLFIKGCIVTFDALNTQKKIIDKIVKEKKADYVAALKGNHETLYKEVEEYFADLERDGFPPKKVQLYETLEKGHGRIEKRSYYYSTNIDWIDAKTDWTKLTGIGMVIRKITIGERVTEERQYHLGSVKLAQEYGQAVREHWGVESMHWSLDITFLEDANRTRTGKAPENLALLRRLAMNAVKKDTEKYGKSSLKNKRFRAALNTDYLDYLLEINFGQ